VTNEFQAFAARVFESLSETVKGVNLIENLKNILSSARSFGIKIVYVPHHQTEKGDYLDWKFRAPSHQGCLKYSLFEKGSWGGEFHPELSPKEGDLIAQNHWTASGFADTNLDFLLKQHNIDHVVIVGMRANTCIDTTARCSRIRLSYNSSKRCHSCIQLGRNKGNCRS